MSFEVGPIEDQSNSYLPGTGASMIKKIDPPRRGLTIALRFGWRLRLPQMWVTRVRNFW